MGSIFNPPKPKPAPKPKPKPAPAATPTPEDPEVEEARKRERKAARRRAGRQETILTSGLGDTAPGGQTRVTKLGGAG